MPEQHEGQLKKLTAFHDDPVACITGGVKLLYHVDFLTDEEKMWDLRLPFHVCGTFSLSCFPFRYGKFVVGKDMQFLACFTVNITRKIYQRQTSDAGLCTLLPHNSKYGDGVGIFTRPQQKIITRSQKKTTCRLQRGSPNGCVFGQFL